MNPHCEHCIQLKREEMEQKELDREINAICQSCENLKLQLGQANNLINKLVNNLIEPETKEVIQDTKPQQVIQTHRKPFSVIRNELETASRLKAQEIAASKKANESAAKPDAIISESVEKLESEIGIQNAGSK